MNLTTLIPAPYRFALLALLSLVLVAFGWAKGAAHVQAKWNAAEGARAQAVTTAVLARVAANKKEAERQAAVNQKITEGKDNEIATLTARINAAGRLRVGPAICGGFAAPAQTEGAGRGDGADSRAGLVSAEADRDFKSLMLDVEKDLATGRACQAFVRENDMAP